MQIETFCYFGLLKGPGQLAAAAALLPDEERAKVEALLAKLEKVAEADMKKRWMERRESEIRAIRKAANSRAGGLLERLPPLIQRQVLDAVIREGQSGRKDY